MREKPLICLDTPSLCGLTTGHDWRRETRLEHTLASATPSPTFFGNMPAYPRNALSLAGSLLFRVFPLVRRELSRWRAEARAIEDADLRRHALSSIHAKAFHCEGGAVYATGRVDDRRSLVRVIVAYQTLVDYLDTLCDRGRSWDPEEHAALHEAALVAVDLERTPDVLSGRADAGYIRALVDACREELGRMPCYVQARGRMLMLVTLYCELQTYKHAPASTREGLLLTWWRAHRDLAPDLAWNEFASATGSTLGLFHLFRSAAQDGWDEENAVGTTHLFVPWVGALHILLDYLIDQAEDRIGSDLNFIACYEPPVDVVRRLEFVEGQARVRARLIHPFHVLVVEGLLALYLSDDKVRAQPEVAAVARVLASRWSVRTRLLALGCRAYRRRATVVQPPRDD